MGALVSLSEGTTVELLHISIAVVFIFGVAVALGLVGELLWESGKKASASPWEPRRYFSRKKLYRACEVIVIAGVVGELIGDAGVFVFSGQLQAIFEVEIGPRRLTEEQSKALIKLWHKYAGKDVEVSWNGTDESRNFEWQLEDILRYAGLHLKPPTPSGARESAGVTLSGNWDDLDMMATMADSLNANGIVAIAVPHCGAIPNAPPSFVEPRCPFRIDVNDKPIGVSPLPPMPRKVYSHILHETGKPR